MGLESTPNTCQLPALKGHFPFSTTLVVDSCPEGASSFSEGFSPWPFALKGHLPFWRALALQN